MKGTPAAWTLDWIFMAWLLASVDERDTGGLDVGLDLHGLLLASVEVEDSGGSGGGWGFHGVPSGASAIPVPAPRARRIVAGPRVYWPFRSLRSRERQGDPGRQGSSPGGAAGGRGLMLRAWTVVALGCERLGAREPGCDLEKNELESGGATL